MCVHKTATAVIMNKHTALRHMYTPQQLDHFMQHLQRKSAQTLTSQHRPVFVICTSLRWISYNNKHS